MAKVINIKNRLAVVTKEEVEEVSAPVVTPAPAVPSPEGVKVVKSKKAKPAPQKIAYKVVGNCVKVAGLLTLIAGVTSYLVYQNYEFFGAIIKGGHTLNVLGYDLSVPAILNSIVAEIILLASAAYTSSKKLATKSVAWVLLVGMIAGLGVFMHASIDNDLTGNSDYVQSLKSQKQDAVKAKEGYEVEKNELDALKWKSRRAELQKKIDAERTNIVALDSKIAEAKEVNSGNLQAIVLYNTILRIAAMLINALLAHTLIARLKD